MTYYDRLSAQDNSFLLMETHDVHMHVASTMVFDSGPLRTEDGGVDVSAILATLQAALPQIVRYRQKLQWIPFENHAVWVDDPNFDLEDHIRHTSLPKPGTPAQLKQLAARVMSQPLDRNRPLWETWVVEGLDGGDSFALITKVHHCMIDGASGVDLAQVLLSPSSEPLKVEALPLPAARPAPTPAELTRDEAWRRLSMPLQILRGARSFIDEAEDLKQELTIRGNALINMFSTGISADETPLNGKVGPHRAFDWLELSLDDLKEIRRVWGCSLNDVVLTIVTGAVRNYLIRRGVDPSRIEFKVSTPVSVRTEEQKGQLGNQVSSWIIPIPIELEDPKAQLDAIHEETSRLKETRQALAVEMIMKVAEVTPSTLLSLGAQSLSGPINTIVTNVPGPQFPLYCNGAKLKGIYPQVPLLENLGLGIALMSYDGKACWGFNTDPSLVPDGDLFVEKVKESVNAVRVAAGLPELVEPKVEPAKKKRKARSKKVAAKSNGSMDSGDKPAISAASARR